MKRSFHKGREKMLDGSEEKSSYGGWRLNTQKQSQAKKKKKLHRGT